MIRSLPPPAVLKALLDALDNAGLGCTVIIERGSELVRAYANEPLARIYGMSLDELRALPPMATFSEEDRARMMELAAAPRSPSRVLELLARRADGTTVPVEIAVGDAMLEGSRAVFVFVRDVSTKHTMEAALHESEARFRSVAEASPDLITVYANGRYAYANPVAMKYLGVSTQEELEALDAVAATPPERRAAINALTERIRRGERPPPLEVAHRDPEGNERILELSLSCTTFGGEAAVVAYARDISERVHLQAELMKQDRLASVGMLAAGVAHELNNPLTSLTLQARKLRADAEKYQLPTEVRQTIAQMDEAASRMSAIIGDLLFMARPLEVPQMHVDVAQILSSTVALLRAGTPECPAIQSDVEPLPAVQGHPSKLGKVFLNVLRNAVQAVQGVPDGSIHIRARALRDFVEIAIADNGPGIPSDVLPRVTQPFFTTKRNGTGLGLWISQSLVAHHGGTLDVSSAERGGTTVTVRLPERMHGDAGAA